jgi:glucan phosphoethanolaminetransferase (alkaline phosphatase superfamily)
MFALGITLKDKSKQKLVYPNIGPIFGYFELVTLIVLLATGIYMIFDNGLLGILFTSINNEIIDVLRTKIYYVLVIVIVTIIHFYIALKTNSTERTKLEHMISRGSSMLIFILNLVVLYYAIILRGFL